MHFKVECANDLNNLLPPSVQNSPIQYIVKPDGSVIAAIEEVAAGKILIPDSGALLDPVGMLGQSGNLFNQKKDGNKKPSGGKQPEAKGKPVAESEPAKGTDAWNKKHPNGTYEGADYHKEGQSTNWGGKVKSPEPHNGQKCLDNSYGVKDYPHRVAIEDGKVVVIRKTANGNYHGYICDAWKDVPSELQAVLRKEKLVHPKSGEVLKNRN